MDLASVAKRRYELVQELREFLESYGGPNWRTDPCDLPIDFGAVTEDTILVDVKKADMAWSKPKHVAFRISAQGGNEIDDRTQRLVEHLKARAPLDPPEAYYSKESQGLDFSDGRHRFSLLRDAGVLVLPMNSDSPDTLKELEANPEEILINLKKEQQKEEQKIGLAKPFIPRVSRFSNPKKILEPMLPVI